MLYEAVLQTMINAIVRPSMVRSKKRLFTEMGRNHNRKLNTMAFARINASVAITGNDVARTLDAAEGLLEKVVEPHIWIFRKYACWSVGVAYDTSPPPKNVEKNSPVKPVTELLERI